MEVVFAAEKAGAPIVAALDEMGRYARQFHPWPAWHGSSLAFENASLRRSQPERAL